MSMAEQITQGVDWWLRAEVRESRDGRNRVLDSFDLARASYARAPYDIGNIDAAKTRNHHARFNLLLEHVRPDDLCNDYIAGKIIHHALMFVSGGFRTQSFLQARNQAEYEDLRFGRNKEANGAAGLPIEDIAAQALGDIAVHEQPDSIDLDALMEQSRRANDEILLDHYRIYRWFNENPDRETDRIDSNEVPVRAVLDCQRNGLMLAVSHIAMAAESRNGNFERVPFLEPKSITDVSIQPIYPLDPNALLQLQAEYGG